MRLFDEESLRRRAEEHRDNYARAEPFPHIVLDDFLPPQACERLLAEFPSPEQIDWMRFDRHHSRKLATQGDRQFGDFTREVLRQLNEPACLRFLERLTGITGLIPDPYFEGGGLHQIQRDGFLKVHTDFNWHNRLQLDRRINLIVYLNRDWREEYNGHLELWDRRMTRCVRKVPPLYNRCVIFSTTDWSYHGHPEKLACPAGMTRKSLALYYYTNGRPAEEKSDAHGTLWQERPAHTVTGKILRRLASVAEGPGRLLRWVATRVER
jgi:hypothetical protein